MYDDSGSVWVVGWGRQERERERERQTDRQTDRQKDRQTKRLWFVDTIL